MFDYRLKQPVSKETNGSLGKLKKTVLEPILENQAAHIAHLRKPTSEYLQ
jgi:hypothetical protein